MQASSAVTYFGELLHLTPFFVRGSTCCRCVGEPFIHPCPCISDEPNEWALDHSKQITNDEANEIPRFIISNAAASSLTKAVEVVDVAQTAPGN